jgi:hypothetical protein
VHVLVGRRVRLIAHQPLEHSWRSGRVVMANVHMALFRWQVLVALVSDSAPDDLFDAALVPVRLNYLNHSGSFQVETFGTGTRN